MRKKWRRLLLGWGGILLLLYVGSYIVQSRWGYAEADRHNMKGFYYFPPENSNSWRIWNYTCMYLFSPLNVADRALGIGRNPASEPLDGLSP